MVSPIHAYYYTSYRRYDYSENHGYYSYALVYTLLWSVWLLREPRPAMHVYNYNCDLSLREPRDYYSYALVYTLLLSVDYSENHE